MRYVERYGGFALVAALSILQLVLIRYSASIPSHEFLFLFYFFNMILLPGHILSRMFIVHAPFPVRLLLAFLFGTAAAFVLLILFLVLHLDIFFLGIVVPVLSVILSATGRSRASSTRESIDAPDNFSTVPVPYQLILLGLAFFVVTLILVHGDPLLYTSDSADHIAYIRSIAVSHEVFPEQFLYKDGGMLTHDIRKGLMHSLWGMLNLLTGRTDAVAIWHVISAIASVFTILALFCAGFLIFRSPGVGLIAAFLFVFVHGGGLTSYRLITTAFAFPTGKVFSLVFLFSVLAFLKNRSTKYLTLMATASFAATGTHIGHLIVCAFILFYTIVGRMIEAPSRERRELLRRTAPLMAAVTAGVNIPYVLIRYMRDYDPNNVIHSHLQGVFWITDGLYTVNPVTVFLNAGVLGLLGILSVFILWRQSKREENLRLLLWGTIALWGILFNPLLIPPIMRFMSYLVLRLSTAVPASLVAAVLIKRLWDRSRGRHVLMSKKTTVFGWIAVIVCIGYQLAVTPSGFAYSGRGEQKLRSGCLNVCDINDYINSNIPDGSVIASDPLTSYCIPAFTDQFVVCTNDQHSVPNDSTALDRIRDCRDIFSPLSTMREIVTVIERYGVDYIVVNGRIPRATGTHYWKPDREMALQAIERFGDHPSLFGLEYMSDDAALFAVSEGVESAAIAEESDGGSRGFIGERLSPGEMAELVPSETPGLFIKSVRPARPSVERGGTLELDIEWVAERYCPYRAYVAHIRFDTPFERGPLYREFYGKVYRKILENLRGERYRFRYDHLPLNGLFTPERWPVGRVVKDRVMIRIPRDVHAGMYTVSVKMAIGTHYPNYSLRDLLNDDDSYDGPDVARVAVE